MPNKIGNVLNWASELDENALEQAQRAASLPFIEGHVALMPDAHMGKGATIGSVIPTSGAIVPSAVGVDIGCGMHAARLDLTSEDLPDNLNELHDRISKAVPSGVGKGHNSVTGNTSRERQFHRFTIQASKFDAPMTEKQGNTAFKQFGSLGSGNHFVEVCLDEQDRVWVVLHSGSRGIGNQLATQHIEKAKNEMKRLFIELPDPDLAYLVEGTPEFERYVNHMLWAQDYALANRDAMMAAITYEFSLFLGRQLIPVEDVQCHHNFCEKEHHNGKNVWVTRKGAIRARVGDRGVIPGSMGTQSFIVSGKGAASSYNSCSHGAGRKMSRGKARRELDLHGLTEAMEGKAWNSSNVKALIDEDPRSYKDIGQVMADQEDLVEIDHVLSQILNYKGV